LKETAMPRPLVRRLAALAAATLMIAATAGCASSRAVHQEQPVDIPGPAVRLPGVVFTPTAGPERRRPAIVLMHGCGGMRDRSGALTARHRDWAERFASWGYVALLVDSFTPRGTGPICNLAVRPVQPWVERTSDAAQALRYLAGRADVDRDRIFVLGWSHGGSTVTGVVRPGVLDTDKDGLRFRAAVAFYPGCTRPLKARAWTSTMPLLILHGAADDWTPAGPCVDLADRFAPRGVPIRTIVYPDAHHGFDTPVGEVRRLPDVWNPLAPNQRGAHVGRSEPARQQSIAATRAFFGQFGAR